MKSLFFTLTFGSLPALVSTAVCAEVPAALMNFPGNGMRITGETVSPAPTPEFIQMQQAILARLQTLPPQRQQAFFAAYDSTQLIPYSEDLWPDRSAYEAYRTEWKKIELKAQQVVQLGAFDKGNNQWSLHGISVNTFTRQTSHLAISGFVYHADRNVWTSSNGEMTAKPFTTNSDNLYGARTGTTWLLNKSDAMSRITESLTISRRTNGEFLYLSYQFSERAQGSGNMLAQGNYTMRFRVGPPAPDPEEAKPEPPEVEQPQARPSQPAARPDSSSRRNQRRHNRRRRRR